MPLINKLYLLPRFLVLFLLFSVPAVATAQVTLEKGLVAYYPFNGNFNDESSNKNHPVKVSAKLTTDRNHAPNSACNFDGKTSFIRIADHPALHFRQSFSISAWVQVNNFYEGLCHGNRIIMKGPQDYLGGNYFLTFDDNYSSNGSNCENDRPDKKRQTFYAPNASPTGPHYIKPGKWYHLTYIYDGENARLYANCTLVASGTVRNYRFSNNYDLFFGKMDNSQYPYWFNGCLDEVRIYNRALNTDEIRALCSVRTNDITPCVGINKPSANFSFSISNCTTVAFRLTSISKTEIKAVKWLFGDGTSSTEKSPVHIFQKTGIYKIKAVVTNQSGCADTVSKEIKLMDLIADFVYNEKGNPGEIEFRAKNNKAVYSWDFGDGINIENETVVRHLYTNSGNYTAKATVRNPVGCADTILKNIRIVLPEILAEKSSPVAEEGKEIEWVQAGLNDREKDVQQTIQLEHDSVTIALYDNGIVDGDSVTLIYNDRIIATHLLLSSKPVVYAIKIDPKRSSNEIIMYAENIGSIPPNTALMIVNDGEKRHPVNISSTTNTNGAVSFILKDKRLTSSQ